MKLLDCTFGVQFGVQYSFVLTLLYFHTHEYIFLYSSPWKPVQPGNINLVSKGLKKKNGVGVGRSGGGQPWNLLTIAEKTENTESEIITDFFQILWIFSTAVSHTCVANKNTIDIRTHMLAEKNVYYFLTTPLSHVFLTSRWTYLLFFCC